MPAKGLRAPSGPDTRDIARPNHHHAVFNSAGVVNLARDAFDGSAPLLEDDDLSALCGLSIALHKLVECSARDGTLYGGKSLSRFFLEVLQNLRALTAKTFVLDGEL